LSEAITLLRARARSLGLKLLRNDPITLEYDGDLGIPVVDYGGRSGVRIGVRVNPLYVALYACKQMKLERVCGPILVQRLPETESEDYVRRAVGWLLANQQARGSFRVWVCDFPWPPAHLNPPWSSALAEAFGALVLLEKNHLNDARLHLQSLLTDFREGGLGYPAGGALWFLEYPSSDPPLVLNCMLHCLAILKECSKRINDPSLERGFSLAFETLRRDIGMFDASFYTYYDSNRTPAEKKYHEIHVALLQMLYEASGEAWLLPWIDRWNKYLRSYSFIEPVIFGKYLLGKRTGIG